MIARTWDEYAHIRQRVEENERLRCALEEELRNTEEDEVPARVISPADAAFWDGYRHSRWRLLGRLQKALDPPEPVVDRLGPTEDHLP